VRERGIERGGQRERINRLILCVFKEGRRERGEERRRRRRRRRRGMAQH
jgi:hypothetical protein